MNNIGCSVIIPTYNRSRILEQVIPAICNQDYDLSFYEVILVDDGSTDDTEKLIGRLYIPGAFTYIKLDKKGSARARNEGIRRAKGEIIIFIDSDLLVIPSFLKEHISFHKKFDKIIVRGAVIQTYDLENPFLTQKKITDISKAYFATGNTSLRKEHLIKAGFFDEDFRDANWEDLEFGVRLKKLGLKVVDNSLAKGYHYQKKFTIDDFPAREEREKNRAAGAVLFYKKHPTFEVRLMIQNFNFFFLFGRSFFYLKFLLPPKEKIASFFIKKEEYFLLTIVINFYFFIKYLQFFEIENRKSKNE